MHMHAILLHHLFPYIFLFKSFSNFFTNASFERSPLTISLIMYDGGMFLNVHRNIQCWILFVVRLNFPYFLDFLITTLLSFRLFLPSYSRKAFATATATATLAVVVVSPLPP